MPLGLFSRPFSEHDSNDSTRAPLWGATTTNRFPRRPSAVSTHAPLWGATATSCPGALGGSQFQPTRPYGARRVGYVRAVVVVGFNPRAPMGRDRRGPTPARQPARFNSHAPMGRDTPVCAARPIPSRFNSRAPMGRDVGQLDITGLELVSTHAPLWGATPTLLIADGTAVFQPTRPYGARPRPSWRRPCIRRCFNPRAPMGRDERMHLTPPPCCEFQPTRPYGARPRGSAVARCPASRFQPTRPYGARRRGCGPIGIRAGFNPRAPMGRDCVDMGYTWDGMMFQPTRPYGARPVPPLLMISGGILFQPTRPYGARHRRRRHRQGRGRFQPTRPYGARLQRWPSWRRPCIPRCFNPRAPMGRDWQFMQDSAFFTYSIHFSRCVAPCATSKLPLWTCHSARTS